MQPVAGEFFRNVSCGVRHDAARFRVQEALFCGQTVQEEIDGGNAFRGIFTGAVARVEALEDDDGLFQPSGNFPADGADALEYFPVRVFRKVVRA